jgi:hypothetical protein
MPCLVVNQILSMDWDLTALNYLLEVLARLKLLVCDHIFKLCIIELLRESRYDSSILYQHCAHCMLVSCVRVNIKRM